MCMKDSRFFAEEKPRSQSEQLTAFREVDNFFAKPSAATPYKREELAAASFWHGEPSPTMSGISILPTAAPMAVKSEEQPKLALQ